MSIEAAIAELERSPALLDHIAQLQKNAEDEQRRREQFYNDIDEDSKAEFINGQVIMRSPGRAEHLDASFFTTNLVGNFVLSRQLGKVYSEKCLVHCQRNDYEPDVCFFGVAKASSFTAKQRLFPPPDLIVEILAPSTERNDRTLKLRDYARHGISEYWIIDADDRMVEQYVLPPDSLAYELKARLAEGGRLVSVVLPGFGVPVAALFDSGENQRALTILLTGRPQGA